MYLITSHSNYTGVMCLFVRPSILQSQRDKEMEWIVLHLIMYMFTFVFVTLSILQCQFIEERFKKIKYFEHSVMLLLFVFTLGNCDKMLKTLWEFIPELRTLFALDSSDSKKKAMFWLYQNFLD